jgi:hypothetical protein
LLYFMVNSKEGDILVLWGMWLGSCEGVTGNKGFRLPIFLPSYCKGEYKKRRLRVLIKIYCHLH